MSRLSPHFAHRSFAALVALLAATVVAGCSVPAPEGDAPLRYRDLIFSGVTSTTGVAYGAAPLADGSTQQLTMDLYQPTGDTERYRPVMIWIHGGYFRYGSSSDTDVTTLAKRFAQRGYVTASLNYRLLGTNCSAENFEDGCTTAAFAASSDAKAAVRWFRAHADEYRIDPDAIAIGGSSAGAITSILVASTANSAGDSGNPGYSNAVNCAVSISGALPTNLTFGKGDAPILFWHGTADTIVPYDWAVDNVDYMNSHGLIAVLRNVTGAGHVPFATYGDDMDEQARNFVFRAMGL
ncbi:MAG: alpha/beta hydrolase [Patulibacter sp.]